MSVWPLQTMFLRNRNGPELEKVCFSVVWLMDINAEAAAMDMIPTAFSYTAWEEEGIDTHYRALSVHSRTLAARLLGLQLSV